MEQRIATVTRTTKETDITVTIDLDGTGKTDIDTGVPFFDHMLDAFGRHGLFDLTVHAKGDIEIDAHHTVEDTGIVLGQAIDQALGDKRGIVRYGSIALPMDETLILTAVDLSGRAHLQFRADFPTEKIGTFDTELIKEFWLAFVRSAACTLHIKMLDGENSHHIAEGIFKSAARSLKTAVGINAAAPDEIPSTKGAL